MRKEWAVNSNSTIMKMGNRNECLPTAAVADSDICSGNGLLSVIVSFGDSNHPLYKKNV
jgi:hypothetical protein